MQCTHPLLQCNAIAVLESGGGVRLPGTLRNAPIDAFQQHRQLRRRQRYRTTRRTRPDEPSTFQALGEQAHPLAVPPQHLDQITTSSPKHEQVSVERIGCELRLHPCGQPVEPAPHVRDTCRQPHPRA